MPELKEGTSLGGGNFKILKFIGEGGFAEVYEAYHKPLDIEVAIKLLKHEYRGQENFVSRFQNEARIIARLRHENIIQIYHYDEQEFYFVMDKLYGNLIEEYKQGRLSTARIIRVSIDIAKALSFIGEHDIVHFDIKPSNIMFNEKGTAILTDFGIARRKGTRPQAMAGTIHYMSPEQINGEVADSRSDLFSFGIMLYEIVTGRLPFNSKDVKEVEHEILEKNPKSPSRVSGAGNIDPRLENIILKLLQKNKENRYPTALGLIEELKAIKDSYRDKILENANQYLFQNRFRLAMAELNTYLDEADPDDTQIKEKSNFAQLKQHAEDAQNALERGDLKKAKSEINATQNLIIKNNDLKKELDALDHNINSAERLLKNATEFLNKGKIEDARKKFDELKSIESRNSQLDQQIELCDELIDALSQNEQENYQTAMEKLQKVAKKADELGYQFEFLNEKIADIETEIIKYKTMAEDHLELINRYTMELPISRYKVELEEALQSKRPFDKNGQEKLARIYAYIHHEIVKRLEHEDRAEKIREELNLVLQFDPDFNPAKIKFLELEAIDELAKGNYVIARQKYEDLALLEPAFRSNIGVVSLLYDAKLHQNKKEYTAALDGLNHVEQLLKNELIKNIDIIQSRVQKLRQEIEQKELSVEAERQKERAKPPASEPTPTVIGEQQRAKRPTLWIGIGSAVILIVVIFVLLKIINPTTPPKSDADAFIRISKIDNDPNFAFEQKIQNWTAFGDSFPSSANVSYANSRIEFWQRGVQAFLEAEQFDKNGNHTSQEKIASWENFKKNFSQDNQKLEYADQRIHFWTSKTNATGPPIASPSPEQLALQNTQKIDCDQKRSSGEKEQAWQTFIDQFQTSTKRAEAESRREHWRSERIFEATNAIDRDNNRTPEEKIAAWQGFINNYPTSDRRPEAERRVHHWDLFFMDNFSDNSNNWPTTETYFIHGGKYKIFLPSTAKLLTSSNTRQYDNFELECSSLVNSGDMSKVYSVAFRIKDAGNYYLFGISGDGKYHFQKKVNYNWQSISQETSQAIHSQIRAANIIKIIADGQNFRFYVNGSQVANTQDNAISSGRIGLYVDTGIEAHFDYIKIGPLTN